MAQRAQVMGMVWARCDSAREVGESRERKEERNERLALIESVRECRGFDGETRGERLKAEVMVRERR